MSIYRECCRCVMDSSDPLIIFDAEGRCNHCSNALGQYHEVVFSGQTGRLRMEQRIEGIRKRNRRREFDAVIGLSGGVDSSCAAVQAARAGLRLLAVHCDTGWNSEQAVHNIRALVDKLGIHLETVVVDWESMRDLQAAFFRASVPNCDIPQDHAIIAVINLVAAKVGVKDFISGGNFASESILPRTWGHDARDLLHLKAIARQFGSGALRGFPHLGAFSSYFWLPFMRGVRTYRILNDIKYDLKAARQELQDEFGWKDYGGKHHESRFTRFFQAYYLPEKFGFDKRRAHLSSLVVANQLNREEACEQLSIPLFALPQLARDKEYFLKKLRISEDEWDSIMKAPPRSHEEFPNLAKWQLIRTRVKESLESRGIKVRRNR
jgi:N-acetyl sugar amidotransferase